MSLKNIKILFFLIFLIFAYNTKLFASPKDFISELTTNASSILASSLSKNEKMQELVNLAEINVDIDGIICIHSENIGKCLAKSKKNMRRCLKIFLKSSRLSSTDPKINVLSEEVINKKYTIVKSVLQADEKRPEIKIDWRCIQLTLKNL